MLFSEIQLKVSLTSRKTADASGLSIAKCSPTFSLDGAERSVGETLFSSNKI